MPYRPNFPIPDNIHAELMCLQLMIPDDPTWKSVVAGLLYELQYWFNWQRDDEQSGRQCAAVWKQIYSSIDWSTMSCCCDEPMPVQYRYDEDGNLERSTDGGLTFEPAPEYDPRNYSPQFPSIPVGDDPKCVAAASGVAAIESQVGDQLTDDMSSFTLAELIKTWVGVYLETSNPFLALMTVITNQIFALVIATLRPALTSDVYEQLNCILYCRMKDDLSFDNAGWGLVRSDILDEIDGIAGIFLEHLVYLLGAVGLTNIVRSGLATTGDCSECCPDCADLWVINPEGVPEGYHGSILSYGDNVFRGQSSTIPDGGGRYYFWAWTGSSDVCCGLVSAAAISGSWSPTDVARVVCGQPNVDIYIVGNPDGTSVWSVFISSFSPFVADFTFA